MTAPSSLPEVSFSELDGVRYLHLGTVWVQGAMRLRSPQKVELDYVQRMLAALLWLPTASLEGGRAVQLGLGAAALTRFTAQALRWKTLAVELNPQVVGACRAWFRLPEDHEDLSVVVADAGRWVQPEVTPLDWDGEVRLLQVDLYDEEAAAPVIDDVAFYCHCRRLLEPGGLMSVNLFGRDASFKKSARLIAEAFGADQVWTLKPTREGNTVVVAGKGVQVPDRETLQARAELLTQRFKAQGLPAMKWLRMVSPWQG